MRRIVVSIEKRFRVFAQMKMMTHWDRGDDGVKIKAQ
jgi:hypothetical protein